MQWLCLKGWCCSSGPLVCFCVGKEKRMWLACPWLQDRRNSYSSNQVETCLSMYHDQLIFFLSFHLLKINFLIERCACYMSISLFEANSLILEYITPFTGVILAICSLYMMMNTKTRKISLEKEVGAEMKHVVFKSDPIINKAKKKLQHLDFETADYIRTGLRVSVLNLLSNYS